MYGEKRCPDVIYSRASLIENQVKWLTEKNISSILFSAAYDLVSVPGNVYRVNTKNSTEHVKTFYVNSSKFLVQENQANYITPERIKNFKAKNSNPGATYDRVRYDSISLHCVLAERLPCFDSCAYYWAYRCIGCLGFQVFSLL